MAFEAHGQATIYWRGNILVVEPSGSINEEGSKSFSRNLIGLVNSGRFKRWCRVEYVKDPDALGTPGAEKDFHETLIYCQQSGCIKMACVGGNNILRQQFMQICNTIGMPYEEYPDIESAFTDLCATLDSSLPSSPQVS